MFHIKLDFFWLTLQCTLQWNHFQNFSLSTAHVLFCTIMILRGYVVPKWRHGLKGRGSNILRRLYYSLDFKTLSFLFSLVKVAISTLLGTLLASCIKINTVELGYSDHGYNEYMAITNKIPDLVWFSMFYQNNFMGIANRFSELHGYNERFLLKSLQHWLKIIYFKANFEYFQVFKNLIKENSLQ